MTEALAATQAQLESLEMAALVQVACRGHITAAAAHRLYHPIGTVATAQSGPDTIRAVCTVLCVYHREAVG